MPGPPLGRTSSHRVHENVDMRNIVIMGAGGRDFHVFTTVYRDDPTRSGGGLHRGPDPGHRRPDVPPVAGRPALPGRHPDRPGGAARRPDRRAAGRRGGLRLLRHRPRGRDAQGVAGDGRWGGLPACWAGSDHAAQHEARGGGRRRAHGVRQEPDDPRRRAAAARRWPAGGAHPPPDALRRPRGDARPAVRDAGRHRRQQPDRRGARGVRGARRAGHGHVRRRRLRGDPARGRAGGRRHRLGRGQQRLPLRAAGRDDHRRRPAAARARAVLPPRRDDAADGRRRGRQQGRQR